MRLDQKTLQQINEIGIALSKERKVPRLLEKILVSAKELMQVDGGTIYTVVDHVLHFEIALSNSLGVKAGGTSNIPVPFPDLSLFLSDGSFNDSLMVAYAVNHKQTVNVKDAYHEKGFDFSGTRHFDELTGYRTCSVLTVPIKDHEENVIAVMQMINPLDGEAFSQENVQFAESLASQAGVALSNQLLIANLRSLFESLIRVISEAIDEKSPSTGNHNKRVPIIAQSLAVAVDSVEDGPFKEVHFTAEELYELKIASFLHDCGKITTPIHIIEKRNRLETVFDRIDLVNARFIALCEKTEKEWMLKKLQWFETHYPREFASAHEELLLLDKHFHETIAQFNQEKEWIQRINEGNELVTEKSIVQLQHISMRSCGADQPLLTPDELENLSIQKGNLTNKERELIQHHVVMTYRMLSQLDFPKDLRKVPEIAAAHHERVDGSGYPLGLKREQMSVQARILAIADVFEALSAPDRPYKKALLLSEVLHMMQQMVDSGHLDSDLFNIFLKQKVYLPYAHQYLDPDQIDE